MTTKTFKYDFFISYRHADPDLEIASYLHRLLEQYKIPKEIRKKSGKKKISRVFRDEDELSASSDLSQDIREQLSNSEYLIVICSPNTRESRWVDQEIRTFMEVRDEQHILPVLIEGEPEDSFPDILLKTEPMAADFRGATKKDIRKRCKSELLRLVAPALHCSYDELKQRHKTYQMQRVAIGASVLTIIALLFFSYSTYQSIQIAQNYRAKQENQARLLADKSSQLLEEADREAALLVALEALPENEDDDSMPLVGDAQMALEDALYLYNLPEEPGYFPNRILHMQNYASMTYALDKETRILTTCDTEYNVYFWDLDTEELLSTYNLQKRNLDCKKLYLISDEIALICTSDVIIGFDYLSGSVIWEWESGEELPYMTKFALSPDRSTLAINDQETVYDEALNGQNYFLIYYIDVKSGSTRQKIREPYTSEAPLNLGNLFWAPDNNRLFFEVYTYEDEENTELYLVDLENTTLEHYITLPFVKGMADGSFLYKFQDDSTLVYVWTELYPSWNYYYPVLNYHVHCMDINTKETLWEVDGDGISRDTSPQISFLRITFEDGSTDFITTVNVYSEVINIYQGQVISDTSYNSIVSTVINQSPMQIHLSDSGILYQVNIANGMTLNTYYGKSSLGVENILAAESLSENELIVFKEDSGNIYLFNRDYDDSGLLFEGSEYATSSAIYNDRGDYIINVLTDYDKDIDTITIWDAATGKIYYQDSITLEQSEHGEIWGFFGNDYFYYTTNYGVHMYSLSKKTKISHYDYNKANSISEEYKKIMRSLQISNGENPSIFFLDLEDNIIKLSGEKLTPSLILSCERIAELLGYVPNEESGLFNYIEFEYAVSPQGKYLVLYDTKDNDANYHPLILWDIEKQELVSIPEINLYYKEYGSTNSFVFSEDDSHLLVYDTQQQAHSINITTGTEETVIDLEGDSYHAFYYSSDNRYIFLHSYDYLFKIYDTEKQEYTMITDEIFLEITSWEFYEEDSYLCIESDKFFTFPYQLMLRRIDDGKYEVFSTVSPSVDANQNHYLILNADNGLYQYKRLELDEMLTKAREFLGDRELTELEKQKYNIEG